MNWVPWVARAAVDVAVCQSQTPSLHGRLYLQRFLVGPAPVAPWILFLLPAPAAQDEKQPVGISDSLCLPMQQLLAGVQRSSSNTHGAMEAILFFFFCRIRGLDLYVPGFIYLFISVDEREKILCLERH